MKKQQNNSTNAWALQVALSVALLSISAVLLASSFNSTPRQANKAPKDDANTATPIKHVIVIVGENRTFDHIFATYQPKSGETVNNLLSEGIVIADGNRGPNYASNQYSANITGSTTYQSSPVAGKTVYLTSRAAQRRTERRVHGQWDLQLRRCQIVRRRSAERLLQILLTGGSELTGKVPDSRINGVHGSAPYSTLMPGPFQLTNSTSFPYDSYANSPVHRFYQMWQQMDCNIAYATPANPSGCKADLFPWTEVTVGSNVNGKAQPMNFSTDYAPNVSTTGEGATSMAFYNISQGDAPYFKYLADNYAMSDNYHQPVMGGTGANSIMLGFGDAIWFSDQNGSALCLRTTR